MSVLKRTTQDMKDFAKDRHDMTDKEIMTVEDNAYTIMFYIKDGKICIGTSNLLGETYFEEIPFEIQEHKENTE